MSETSYRCGICGNHCLITSLKFPNGTKYQTGNRCERGLGKSLPKNPVPNLYAYKLERIFNYEPLTAAEARKGSIGIPRVLNMYEDYPFWFTFFTKLGYRVILSSKSSRALYEQGLETIPSDSQIPLGTDIFVAATPDEAQGWSFKEWQAPTINGSRNDIDRFNLRASNKSHS